ncbi:hypothetical protein M406DRAFT_255190, partial [Cryphonectria parasitica EP155]
GFDVLAGTPVRGHRSLRPRKPIQEHPYLLENAQYSRSMKTHGVKPVRITIEEQEAAARRRHEKDSQDFEYNESQLESEGQDAESQRHQDKRKQRKIYDDVDVDELALSPSPKTSSPPRHLRASSEQSPGQQTNNTSMSEDENFPDISQLFGRKKDTLVRSYKRQAPSLPPSSKKRLRTNNAIITQESPSRRHADAWDLPSSPPPPPPTSASRTDHHRSPTRSSRHHEQEEEDTPRQEASSSDSDSELVRRTMKRIRGVLPASWLRLDQQSRKDKTKSNLKRQSPLLSPDRPRLGLAVRKAGATQPGASTKCFLDELIDDYDHDNDDTQARAERFGEDDVLDAIPDHSELLPLDDGASVVEEDFVDWMLPGQKRKRASSRRPPHKRKKSRQKLFHGEERKRYRQQKISHSVQRLDRPLTNSARRSEHNSTNQAVGQADRAISPPALSIADFAGPDAPKFIRVAARAASKRSDMGRSKPSGKSINLGNRTDNVDALSVLKAWRIGKIAQTTPKAPRPPVQQKLPITRQALRPLSANVRRQPKSQSGLSFIQPQKLTRHVQTDNNFASAEESTPRSEVHSVRLVDSKKTVSHSRDDHFRPAQLEADVLHDESDFAFTARKKMLDLLFRKNRREVLARTFHLRRSPSDKGCVSAEPPSEATNKSAFDLLEVRVQRDQGRKTKTPRARKLVLPRRLDLKDPQFQHANDPLPFFDEPTAAEAPQPLHQGQSKVTGLGPFGTQYTQHFDIFPLHQDTFFHRDTIVGAGILKKALDYGVSDAVGTTRPAISFGFSNYRFDWGCWTDKVSSELGLLFDLLITNIEERRGDETRSGGHQAVKCSEHILGFILDAVSLDGEVEVRWFTERVSELLLSFLQQTRPSTHGRGADRTLLQINSRFLMCALVVLRLCHGTVELSSGVLQAEDLLKQFAKVIIEQLQEIGLAEVRTTYHDLQRLSTRERGIRTENVTAASWVIVIKVLGAAHMPRAGFWDLTGSIMTASVLPTSDAQKLEGLWSDMFTLLPLGEFDDIGVLSKGMRSVLPLEGWSVPQKLLKVAFECYQSDQRQSPSFNDYCRALLGRCHYLIDQWGWHKCVGIVGTIFDFFGHQNLSHLRNEEVYKSPRFLEELSDGPCLSVEPEDRCFHIFLKILAVAIQNMRRNGLSNDLRNLITRCLPNHNRQYSKEQTIHSHDLASLRNHHDLLCTLFWAAPPEDRRPVDLIEKLVQPASSHKEACLINLRAWRQLARFVVSSGGSVNDYRPFMSWQNNVFQQILTQYLTAAADVQDQFMSMAKEDRGRIEQQMLDGIVAANQAAAKDVLHFSIRASLDVVKHCPSLTAATFSFNVNQLNKVFSKLSVKDGDLDWGIVRACVETIDVLVKQLEDLWYKLRESTNDSVSSHGSREFEDAVEFLDDKIVQGFFAAACRAINSPACDIPPHLGSASAIVEKAIILCGRITSLFIDGGKSQLRHFFSPGKYGIFRALPDELGLAEKRFIPLFVATLLENHVFNFSSISCSHFDIWITSLVKPFHALRYENHLAEILKSIEVGYIRGAIIKPGAAPNYNSNRDLFACGVAYMRRELRQADMAQRKALRAGYQRLLESVMQQMKSHIRSVKLGSTEHQDYVSFIREIVGLIKSHGAEICTVDPFYYQFSAEYSPTKEDPQLHTAGILAYGLRLGEGETTAAPQLFYYLYNHFKSALANGQLDAERRIIESGMRDDNILSFVIGRMLPAIIQASSSALDIWPLLRVYSQALLQVLNRCCLPREIPESCLDDVVCLLDAVMGWMQDQVRRSDEGTSMSPAQIHVLNEVVRLCNAIRPSLICWLLLPSMMDTTQRLERCIDGMTHFAKNAASILKNLLALRGTETTVRDVAVRSLVALAKDDSPPAHMDPHINSFKQTLVREMQDSWIVTPDLITVRVAVASSAHTGTQSMQGVKNDLGQGQEVLLKLYDGVRAWTREMDREEDTATSRKRRRRRTTRRFKAIVEIDIL